jgi:hypothetical protein
MNQLVPISSTTLLALVAAAGERASMRFLEFFATNIRNPHTRRAYARAASKSGIFASSALVLRRRPVERHPSTGASL